MISYANNKVIYNGEALEPWRPSDAIGTTCTRSVWLGQNIVVKIGDTSDLVNAVCGDGDPFNECQTTREIAIWKMVEDVEKQFFAEIVEYGTVIKQGVFLDKVQPFVVQRRIYPSDIRVGFDQYAALEILKPVCLKYFIGDIYPNAQPLGVNWTLLKGSEVPIIYDWGSYQKRPNFVNKLRKFGW